MASRLARLTPETASVRSCRHVTRPGDRDRDLRRGHRLLIRRLIRRCQEMRRRRVGISPGLTPFSGAGSGADEQVELGVLDRRFVPEISGTTSGPGSGHDPWPGEVSSGGIDPDSWQGLAGIDARSIVVREKSVMAARDVVTSVPIQSLTPATSCRPTAAEGAVDEAESMRRGSSYPTGPRCPGNDAEDVREQLAALPVGSRATAVARRGPGSNFGVNVEVAVVITHLVPGIEDVPFASSLAKCQPRRAWTVSGSV